MEHVVPDEWSSSIERVFGARVETALRYHDALASAGVERGLIGPREVPRLWDRHILNCAVLGELVPEGAKVVDVGSGAGLPGIPLAIARPDLAVLLVEPLLRRVNFLEEFVAAANLGNVTVLRGRAEEKSVVKQAGGADVVTSRAVAPLLKLAAWSLPLVRADGVMLAMKGESAAEELARDAAGLRKLGADAGEVLRCGEGIVDPATTVVRLRRTSAQRQRSQRR